MQIKVFVGPKIWVPLILHRVKNWGVTLLAPLLPWSWFCNGGASLLLVTAKGEAKFVAFGGCPGIRVFLFL